MGSYLSSQANTQPKRNNKDNIEKLLPCLILHSEPGPSFQASMGVKHLIPFSKAFKCVSQSSAE